MSEFNESNVLEIAEMLKTATENVERVYAAGHSEGMKSEYDAFWDKLQSNGLRMSYNATFGGGWTEDNFKPKYDLIVWSAIYMFGWNEMNVDLVEYMENLGKKLDFTNCLNPNGAFQGSKFTRVGKIYGRAWYNTFQDCKNLVTIDEWGAINETDKLQDGLHSCFTGCTALENIKVRGIINWNVSFKDSTKLTRESIESIVNHLSDEQTGATLTLSEAAVDTAFSGGISAPDPSTTTENGSATVDWFDLYMSKPNWTITLV